MTVPSCRHCGRDLPADVHHRVRYCPDRSCRHDARLVAKKKRRRAAKPAAGSGRSIGGRRVVYLPGHALDCGSGWIGANRAELYDQLEGADPACATCGAGLDWLADAGGDRRVCAVRSTDDVIALCSCCLAAVRTAGTMLGRHLHPLTWAKVGGSYGPPVNGGARKDELAAAQETDDLAAAVDRLVGVWDGTAVGARLLAAAATVLDLRARKG